MLFSSSSRVELWYSAVIGREWRMHLNWSWNTALFRLFGCVGDNTLSLSDERAWSTHRSAVLGRHVLYTIYIGNTNKGTYFFCQMLWTLYTVHTHVHHNMKCKPLKPLGPVSALCWWLSPHVSEDCTHGGNKQLKLPLGFPIDNLHSFRKCSTPWQP